MKELLPLLYGSIGALLVELVRQFVARRNAQDTNAATLVGKLIDDGAHQRSEREQRLQRVEARLDEKDAQIEALRTENRQIRAAEERCQGQLKELARQFSEFREQIAKRLKSDEK
jgi:peptidoglycan hydrolase CwlO-like protein